MIDRSQMISLFQSGVAAADPGQAVRNALVRHPVSAEGKLIVLAIGKAARAMMQAALDVLPPPDGALVVTNYENAAPLPGVRVMAAGHPVPDENGLRAGLEVQKMLTRTRDGDVVLALISGGGSALLPAPATGLSLTDKAEVNRLLLGAGLDIGQMNMIRQHLSRIKGGGLLRLAAPARVEALILSDVVGDDLRVIASGPTVSPIAPRSQIVAMLHEKGLWDQLPQNARTALMRPEPAEDLPPASNRLIGSNALSLAAMAKAFPQARIAAPALTGDVADAAAKILAHAATPGVTLWGGETTVTLRGSGRGGRNQELALRVAMALRGQPGWRFLSGGTDGRDGPTDAAGALVDGGTIDRITAAGGNPQALLDNNDSYRALQHAGDLLIIGATGTNVADLQILAVDAPT